VPAREKIKSVAPGGASGSALFSALRNTWKKISSWSQERPGVSLVSHGPDFGNHNWPAELQDLAATLTAVRQRILANAFLRGWMKSLIWILGGLIVAAAFSPKLVWAMISAAVLVVLGATAVIVWMWRTRPTAYGTACRLDLVAGLKDRVSTAVHLGAVENPDGMILRQRQDAVARLAKLSPRALFPIRWPAVSRRRLALAVAAASLLVYRIYYKPPMVALLQTTARSQFVQSILSPIAHAMERDLQKTMALMNSKPDAPSDEAKRGDLTQGADALWQSSDDQGNKMDAGQRDAQEANAGDQQDQGSSPLPQGDMNAGDAQQQQAEGANKSPDGNNGADGKKGDAQQSEMQSSQNSSQSLSQSLMQALKNMLSNSPQQSSSPTNQQPPNAQGMPQSGNSRQPGSGETDKKGDSRGSSDTQQKASQNSSNGAGSQQGSKELKKDQAGLPVNAVPDRIALESTGFKEQMRMRVDAGTGTAQLPVREISPQAVAVTNGAEQENIPARYRLYVQHYFEHAENGQK